MCDDTITVNVKRRFPPAEVFDPATCFFQKMDEIRSIVEYLIGVWCYPPTHRRVKPFPRSFVIIDLLYVL